MNPERDNRSEAVPLANRTLNALAWRFASRFATFGLRLVVLIALARLVSVEAFGLINQALIVIGLAALVSNIGMSPALTQRLELTETHIRVAHTVSLLSGLLLMAAIWSVAPLAAAAFRTPEVIPILRLTSSTCLFTALGSTAGALLRRRLAYRALFQAEFTSYFLGYGVVGVGLAYGGYGVWALVWGAVAQALLRAGFLYAACPHTVWPSLAPVEVRQLLYFGTGTTLGTIANYAALSGDNFIVGRQLGTVALGLYDRAYQLMTLPMTEFSEVVSGVLFPAYAEVQNEPERLRLASLASISASALVVFPLLVILAIVAPELIVLILGHQWEGAVVPLQILCIGGFPRSICNLGDPVGMAKGAIYSLFWRHTVYALCIIGGSFLGSHWGLSGVAISVVGSLFVMYLLMAQLIIRLIETSWMAFFSAQSPGLVLAACVAGLALPVAVLLRAAQLPDLQVLAGTLFSSCVSVVLTCLLVRRYSPDSVIVDLMGSFINRLLAAVRLQSQKGFSAIGSNMHTCARAMQRDMLSAFRKAFQDNNREQKRLKYRSYGSLHPAAGGSEQGDCG